MPVCFFNSLPDSKHSMILIVIGFSNKSVSGKTCLKVKNTYLLKFLEILAVSLPNLFFFFFLLDFGIHCFYFLINSHFINVLSDGKVVSFTKMNEYGSLAESL